MFDDDKGLPLNIRQPESKSMGYALLGEYKCDCILCKRNLLNIIVVQASNKIHKIQAVCPECGYKTFIVEVQGEIYLDSNNSLVIRNIDTQIEKDNTFRYLVDFMMKKTEI